MDLSALQGALNPDRSDLNEFNELADAVDEVLAGRALAENALAALDQVDRVLGNLQLLFLDGLPLREDSALLQEVAGDLDEGFARLRGQIPALRAALTASDEDGVRGSLAGMRGAVEGVCRAFRRLREEDEARETFSESPFVDEIVRVGRAYLRGRLPLGSMELAVARLEDYHRRLLAGLETLEPTAREEEVLERGLPVMRQALARQEQAILELRRFLEDGNEDLVEPALQAILHSTGDLIGIHQRLLESAEREEKSPCPRCGFENAISERFCRECQAVLPRPAPEALPDEPRMDLVESGIERPGEYEHLARLAQAVSDLRRGRLVPETFTRLLERMEGRVRQAKARMARIQDLPPEIPPEQADIYRAARQASADGAARLERGLATLRHHLQDGSPHLLDRGLEMALSAGQCMAEMERLWQEAVAQAG